MEGIEDLRRLRRDQGNYRFLDMLDGKHEDQSSDVEPEGPDIEQMLAASRRKEKKVKKSRFGKKKKENDQMGYLRVNRFLLMVAAAIMVLMAVFAFLSYRQDVKSRVVVEAGIAQISPDMFLKRANKQASFASDVDTIDLSEPGTYVVRIQLAGSEDYQESQLLVKDTVAPQAEPADVQIAPGQTVEASAFVKNIIDETEVEVSFARTPKFEKNGEQTVKIVMEDEGGNKTKLEAGLYIGNVAKSLTIEAGTVESLDAADFLLNPGMNGQLLTDLSDFSLDNPGWVSVQILVNETIHICEVEVQDTMAPQVTVKDKVVVYNGELAEPIDLLEQVEDASEVHAYYLEGQGLDLESGEDQQVFVVVEDAHNNSTLVSCNVSFAEDTEAPVIIGVENKIVTVGDEIDYEENISVEDNSGEEIKVQIDDSEVDLTTAGEYTVTYSAVDPAGNTTALTAEITVQKKYNDGITEEKVYEMVQETLDEFINNSMSQREKVEAVYNWCRENLYYTYESEMEGIIRGAYQALTVYGGNDYIYYSLSRVMLDRLGIENIEIVNEDNSHWWLMVNLGDGWYHFDTAPRNGGGADFCMVTDEFLQAYSDSHDDTHVWDRDKYPATPAD